MRSAAIVTVGSELTEGLRVDTNTAEIARALARRGFRVAETVSIGDDETALAATVDRLAGSVELIVTTGGLGPTHDDVTRDAVARALGRRLEPDPALVERMRPLAASHREAAAAQDLLTQALVIDGAEVIEPTTGTAPGQIVRAGECTIVLLPGPPNEMRGMLPRVLALYESTAADPIDIGVAAVAESDAQIAAQRALVSHDGIALTVLAKPGDVRVILIDEGAGQSGLAAAAVDVARELGEPCYTIEGLTLAETIVRAATARGLTFAFAESCTGGMASAAITDVPGSSACFTGGVVSYANSVKERALGVPSADLEAHGAVSEQVARAMATGVRELTGADIAVAITGVAGPDGGTADKPVGLVWFAVSGPGDALATHERRFRGGNRASVRARATAVGLDLLRRAILNTDA